MSDHSAAEIEAVCRALESVPLDRYAIARWHLASLRAHHGAAGEAGGEWVHSTDGCADGWALVHRRGLNRPDKILVAAHDAERVCGLLNAASPHAPAWSGEAPKVAGFYFYRERGVHQPQHAVRVYEFRDDDGEPRLCCEITGIESHPEVTDKNWFAVDAEWFGPIPPPGAAS